MFLKSLKFLKLLIKIRLLDKKILNSKLIIFDCESLNILQKYVLKDFQYIAISNRMEKIKIYLSINIIVQFVKNYFKFFSNQELLLKNLYFLTLIELINPKIVLTLIDKNNEFSKIAKNIDNRNIKFITLQLTYFPQTKYMTYLFKKNLIEKNLNHDFYFPLYLCFGKHTEELYLENEIKVDNFVHIGSLSLANFLKTKKENLNKEIFDICLISDTGAYSDKFGKRTVQLDNWMDMEKAFIKLIKWTIRICNEHKLKFNFAFKRKKEDMASIDEKQNLKNNLTDNEYNFLLKNNSVPTKNDPYISYKNLFQSRLGVGVVSTLLFEGLAFGKKILSCNLTESNLTDFPIDGLCSLKNCSYGEFESRVLKILKIDTQKYFEGISKDKSYLVSNTDPDQVINSIKKEIIKNLK